MLLANAKLYVFLYQTAETRVLLQYKEARTNRHFKKTMHRRGTQRTPTLVAKDFSCTESVRERNWQRNMSTFSLWATCCLSTRIIRKKMRCASMPMSTVTHDGASTEKILRPIFAASASLAYTPRQEGAVDKRALSFQLAKILRWPSPRCALTSRSYPLVAWHRALCFPPLAQLNLQCDPC